MATYKGIKGYTVRSLASDPSSATDAVGQLWYNSGSNVLKVSVQNVTPVGAWSNGGALTNNKQGSGGIGIQGAALSVGGWEDSQLDTCETYNGSTWTEGANLQASNAYQGCFGTSVAARSCNGQAGTVNEEYNGTSWSEGNNCLSGRSQPGSCGTENAGLVFGGAPATANNESWNGTSWTEENNLTSGRTDPSSFGTQNAGSIVGGAPPPGGLAIYEQWNGTSWSEENNINQQRMSMGGSGENTAGLIARGNWTGPVAPWWTVVGNTESWNGTSWTELADMTYPRTHLGSAKNGPSTAGLVFGGNMAPPGSPYNTYTEEFDDPAYSIKTVTSS